MVNVAGPSGKTRHFAGSFHCWCERSLAWQYTVSFDESKCNDSLQSRHVVRLSIRMFSIFIETYILSVLQTASQGPVAAGSASLFIDHQAPIAQSMRALCK